LVLKHKPSGNPGWKPSQLVYSAEGAALFVYEILGQSLTLCENWISGKNVFASFQLELPIKKRRNQFTCCLKCYKDPATFATHRSRF
jgi:hypothetical protein